MASAGIEEGPDGLARVLFVRYSVQRAIDNALNLAIEALGGMTLAGSPEVSYLNAAARCLVFHPPGRLSAAPALAQYLEGKPLVI